MGVGDGVGVVVLGTIERTAVLTMSLMMDWNLLAARTSETTEVRTGRTSAEPRACERACLPGVEVRASTITVRIASLVSGAFRRSSMTSRKAARPSLVLYIVRKASLKAA